MHKPPASPKLRRLAAAVLAAAVAAWCGGCATHFRDTSRTFSTVVVDAGHGGHDPGALSRLGHREKHLALDVAKRLEPRLRDAGFRTVMTRNDDRFIPLNRRARISNAQDNAIFVSIHFNYSRRRAACGAETYFFHRMSLPLARNIQRELDALPDVDSRGVKKARFRVLRKNRYPAVLVECGFLTNPAEARRCATPSHRDALAAAIARGIVTQRYGRAAAGNPAPAAAPTPR